MIRGWFARATRRFAKAKSTTPPAARYATLKRAFEQAPHKKNILEIGTFKGKTAIALIKTALRHEPKESIHYYGFDLWEDMDEATFANEVSKRRETTMAETLTRIAEGTGLAKSQIHLFRGFSKDTLWQQLPTLPQMDFIFIDGGHSEETVDSDWRGCVQLMRDDTTVIFDDYFHFPFGPRVVVDALDRDAFAVELLEPQDVFPDKFGIAPDGLLKINLAKVVRRSKNP